MTDRQRIKKVLDSNPNLPEEVVELLVKFANIKKTQAKYLDKETTKQRQAEYAKKWQQEHRLELNAYMRKYRKRKHK